MNFPRVFAAGLAVLLLGSAVPPARALEKWVYLAQNLLVEENVARVEVLFQRVAAAGYTHVLLSDSKFARLGEMDERYFRNVERVKKAAAAARLEIVPALFPIGYSNDILSLDPNLIEAMPVRDLPMVVKGGVAQLEGGRKTLLDGGDFSDLKRWFWRDDNVVPDSGAARIDANGANGRIVQKLKLTPFRQYHLSVRIKTAGVQGAKVEAKVLTGDGAQLNGDDLGVAATQDWQTHHVVFNSQRFDSAQLYLGVWGATEGSIWIDDASLEEVAFVNLVRRPGCPLVVRRDDGGVLVEGRDYQELRDPGLGVNPWPGEYDTYHEPPALRTNLPDEAKLRVSYFHGATVNSHQAMICPSEPKTYELLRDQARRMHATWGASGYMMSHDEIRTLNWCDACQRRKLTPGEIIADNVKRCIDILNEVNPKGRIYVWSDMFDPNHNATAGPYYLVNGDLRGSWEGLDSGVIILPWYFEKRAESLRFFAERGHRQIIAGYYDSDPRRIIDWMNAAQSTPKSVTGVMFTTWQNNYSDLEAFMSAVKESEAK
ncbi:MAG: hypothetical protein ABI680_08635 [Chthoniobacteraceae bacterium]